MKNTLNLSDENCVSLWFVEYLRLPHRAKRKPLNYTESGPNSPSAGTAAHDFFATICNTFERGPTSGRERRTVKPRGLGQSEQKIHRLHGLPRGPLDEVVLDDENNDQIPPFGTVYRNAGKV